VNVTINPHRESRLRKVTLQNRVEFTAAVEAASSVRAASRDIVRLGYRDSERGELCEKGRSHGGSRGDKGEFEKTVRREAGRSERIVERCREVAFTDIYRLIAAMEQRSPIWESLRRT